MTAINGCVRTVIASCLGVAAAEVSDTAHLVADLRADSLDLVAIAIGLEEGFGITIRDEDVEAMRTVGDATRIVTEALAARSRGPAA